MKKLFLFLCLQSVVLFAFAQLSVQQLRTENLTNPLGGEEDSIETPGGAA